MYIQRRGRKQECRNFEKPTRARTCSRSMNRIPFARMKASSRADGAYAREPRRSLVIHVFFFHPASFFSLYLSPSYVRPFFHVAFLVSRGSSFHSLFSQRYILYYFSNFSCCSGVQFSKLAPRYALAPLVGACGNTRVQTLGFHCVGLYLCAADNDWTENSWGLLNLL